jgi:hypothetical protein
MARAQRNDNFIDKTFTIMADILLKVFPTSKQEKEAFFIIEMACLLSLKENTLKP